MIDFKKHLGQALGVYLLSEQSGTQPTTIAAANDMYQFRWAHSTAYAVIHSIRLSMGAVTVSAAGIPLTFNMSRCSSWTAQGTLGTALNPSAKNKLWSEYNDSLLGSGDMRIAGTDANGLGGGSKTVENPGFVKMAVMESPTGTTALQMVAPGTLYFDGSRHPLILRPTRALSGRTEGFSIWTGTVPAVPGTFRFTIETLWSEYAGY